MCDLFFLACGLSLANVEKKCIIALYFLALAPIQNLKDHEFKEI